jgi:Ca2+-binding EF-hand superfamily protein
MSAGTDSSTIIASVQKISPTAEITVMDANGNKKSGALVTGDKVVIKTLTSASTTFEIAINGDVNGDGVVDIKDLLRVQKHLLGTVNLSGVTSVAADDNYDGKINVQDLLRIQKSILGSMTL